MDLVIRCVRLWPRVPSETLVDVVVRQGRIDEIRPCDENRAVPASVEAVDGDGSIVLPAFADVHAHLDSTRLGLPFRPHTAELGLLGLIENDRRNWRHDELDVAGRAVLTLSATVAAGAVMVRSHAQVDTDARLERLEGVLAARATLGDRCRVQVVAFPQSGIVRDPGTADLLDAAISAGADLVGGIDPCGFDRDPVGHLDVVFGIAERRQVGVDIHLHEAGELGAFTLELIAERTAALGMQGSVTVSHAFTLSSVGASQRAASIELLADNDIAVTTVAPGDHEPLPLDALRSAGVRVGLGQDGIRDHWSPYGNGDMLERTMQLAYRAGHRRDAAIEGCVDLASRGGRSVFDATKWSTARVVDDDRAGLSVGADADLVLVPAETVTAAVMDHPARTAVISAGRVIARNGTLT